MENAWYWDINWSWCCLSIFLANRFVANIIILAYTNVQSYFDSNPRDTELTCPAKCLFIYSTEYIYINNYGGTLTEKFISDNGYVPEKTPIIEMHAPSQLLQLLISGWMVRGVLCFYKTRDSLLLGSIMGNFEDDWRLLPHSSWH